MPRRQSLSPVSSPASYLMRIPGTITQMSHGWVWAAVGLAVSMTREIPSVGWGGVVLPIALGLLPGVPGHHGRWGFTALYTTPPLIPGIIQCLAP